MRRIAPVQFWNFCSAFLASLCGGLASLPHYMASAGPMDQVLKSVCVVRTAGGLGTGFVVAEPSLIATNFHVIQNAKEAEVEFLDGTKIEVEGFVVASPGYDLAVLRLAADAPGPPLKLRASEADVGIDVFAVGNPKGLAGSVSKGVISARRRWEDMRPLLKEGIHDFGYEIDSRWIQTDAAINGGNSGGPLCLADGTVIAVNTWGTTPRGGQNLNFAIDASHLLGFLERLPIKSSLLSALPPGLQTRDVAPAPARDTLERTQQYWRQLTTQLGAFAVEHQKFLIETGAFKLKQPNVPLPRDNGPEPWKVDPAFGPNQATRNRKMRDLADEAKIPYARARWMTFAELSAAAQQKREKKLADRLEVAKWKENLRLMQSVDGREFLEFLAVSAASSRLKQVADHADRTSLSCSKTAIGLDSIPIDGVHPDVVSFAIDLATAYRSVSVDARQMALALRQQAAGGSSDDALASIRLFTASCSDLMRLRDVQGGDLRAQLRKHFGADFEPVVSLTAEDEKLFVGELAPSK